LYGKTTLGHATANGNADAGGRGGGEGGRAVCMYKATGAEEGLLALIVPVSVGFAATPSMQASAGKSPHNQTDEAHLQTLPQKNPQNLQKNSLDSQDAHEEGAKDVDAKKDVDANKHAQRVDDAQDRIQHDSQNMAQNMQSRLHSNVQIGSRKQRMTAPSLVEGEFL